MFPKVAVLVATLLTCVYANSTSSGMLPWIPPCILSADFDSTKCFDTSDSITNGESAHKLLLRDTGNRQRAVVACNKCFIYDEGSKFDLDHNFTYALPEWDFDEYCHECLPHECIIPNHSDLGKPDPQLPKLCL